MGDDGRGLDLVGWFAFVFLGVVNTVPILGRVIEVIVGVSLTAILLTASAVALLLALPSLLAALTPAAGSPGRASWRLA